MPATDAIDINASPSQIDALEITLGFVRILILLPHPCKRQKGPGGCSVSNACVGMNGGALLLQGAGVSNESMDRQISEKHEEISR
jgi:hypothetical protein